MSVWGNEVVHIVKDVEAKTWEVFTAKHPRQLLVTIPWADAFKNIEHKHAPDFYEALAACRSSERTDLTIEEEEAVLDAIEVAKRAPGERSVVVESPATSSAHKNVVSLDAFRKKKR